MRRENFTIGMILMRFGYCDEALDYFNGYDNKHAVNYMRAIPEAYRERVYKRLMNNGKILPMYHTRFNNFVSDNIVIDDINSVDTVVMVMKSHADKFNREQLFMDAAINCSVNLINRFIEEDFYSSMRPALGDYVTCDLHPYLDTINVNSKLTTIDIDEIRDCNDRLEHYLYGMSLKEYHERYG